ncbi:MAG: hypothetical protein NVS9B4_11710 [Candidatus Acidiferrum sp.]
MKAKMKSKSKSKPKPKKSGSAASVKRLRLYVAGQSPKSLAAISNLKRLCAELPGEYRVEVVDLAKNPGLASVHQILALPTLVKSLPVPIRKIIGDLSDREKVLIGLDARPGKNHTANN